MTKNKGKFYNPDLDTTIKDLTIHDAKIKIHDDLPELPLNMCVYGKSSCGKTNMIINLMNWYKKVFKARILVFTLSHNGTLMNLAETHGARIFHSIIDDNGENIIEKLLKYQVEQKENGIEPKQCLILFDDFISDASFSKKRSIFDKLYSMARHANISVITTSQQYTLLPATIRRLSWYDLIFKISNTAERKSFLYEECNAVNMNESQFEKVYNECVEEPYSFIYINKLKGTWNKRFGK